MTRPARSCRRQTRLAPRWSVEPRAGQTDEVKERELCASMVKCEREREVRLSTEEREKTINILYTHATVTVHICMVAIAIVHFYTSLHPLMWMFFYSNCVK